MLTSTGWYLFLCSQLRVSPWLWLCFPNLSSVLLERWLAQTGHLPRLSGFHQYPA